MRWLYLLAFIPVLTDVIETGHLPSTLRGLATELIVGVVIAALVAKLRREHLAALTLARADALTGLWNRRVFEEAVEDECARARRNRHALTLVNIDLDHFKLINDRDGHQQGDRVLKQLANAMGQAIRARVDRAFRMGGDEFVLLLPDSTAAQAEAVVSRLRVNCQRLGAPWTEGTLAISAGIVEFDGHESSAEFAQRADEAMYHAKRSRRDPPLA